MKAEKVILSFIAVFIGLVVAGVAFYLYQGTKTVTPTQIKITKKIVPSPTPKKQSFLSVSSPTEGAVFDKKTITVAGHVDPGSTVIISKASSDVVLTPASSGTFTTTIDIDDGVNQIVITAISPNGQHDSIARTVTFSTETF